MGHSTRNQSLRLLNRRYHPSRRPHCKNSALSVGLSAPGEGRYNRHRNSPDHLHPTRRGPRLNDHRPPPLETHHRPRNRPETRNPQHRPRPGRRTGHLLTDPARQNHPTRHRLRLLRPRHLHHQPHHPLTTTGRPATPTPRRARTQRRASEAIQTPASVRTWSAPGPRHCHRSEWSSCPRWACAGRKRAGSGVAAPEAQAGLQQTREVGSLASRFGAVRACYDEP
jgi:hypothetical protein